MTLTLLHSPADIARQLLIDIGQGVDVDNTNPNTDWQTFATKEPSSPDNCLTVYNTSRQDDGRSMVDGQQFFHYGLQIRIRAIDNPTGFVKTENVLQSLTKSVSLRDVTVDGTPYLVHCFSKTNNFGDIGKNVPNTLRTIFTINGLITLRRLS